MLLIQIPDDQAAALQAKAAAQGLTLEAWLVELADSTEPTQPPIAPSRPRRHISELICDNMRDVPDDVLASMPTDGAVQHDHYIYGWPKREV
jgi:hypothetical protein